MHTPEATLAALFGRLFGEKADRIRAGDLTVDWHTLAVDLQHWARAAERCDRGEGDMAYLELLGKACEKPSDHAGGFAASETSLSPSEALVSA